MPKARKTIPSKTSASTRRTAAEPRRPSLGIKPKWRRLVGQIPGYDPIATRGDCLWREENADQAVRFIESVLHHVKGEKAGQPLMLEDWQKAIVGCLFGWLRPDGTRRYREAYIGVPRKNGKTTLAAAVVLLPTYLDAEVGQENYCVAGEREQARLCFDTAKHMIEDAAWLRDRTNLFKYSIETKEGRNVIRALTASPESKHGLNPHAVVSDELHVQRTRDLVDAMKTGMGARRQPLLVHITTAGYDRETVCWEVYEYAGKVRDGVIADPSFLPVIYEAEERDDWHDEKVWAKANPNLGVSVSLDFLRAEHERAKSTPAYENTFKRLYLNLWTEQVTRFIVMDQWRACGTDWSGEHMLGRECFGGLDLSTKIDLTAFVLVFRLDDDFHVLPWFWIPAEMAAQREKRDRVPYRMWAREGWVTMTPGNAIDHDTVIEHIKTLAKSYQIREVAFDPYNSQHVVNTLQDAGLSLVEFPQTIQHFNEPCKELQRLIVERKLVHGNHPVMDWNASNVEVKVDANQNLRPVKPKSFRRIDGVVALIMALRRAMLAPAKRTSYYAENDLEFF